MPMMGSVYAVDLDRMRATCGSTDHALLEKIAGAAASTPTTIRASRKGDERSSIN